MHQEFYAVFKVNFNILKKFYWDFDLQLEKRFESLFDEASCEDKQDEIQKRSDALNNALQTTSEQILGKRPKKKQPNWVSSKTLQLMDAQGKIKAAYKQS